MSLINEALKKAQKQRTQEPLVVAPAGGPPPPRVAKRKQPMPAQTLVMVACVCLLLIGALIGGAWFVFNGSTPVQTPAVVATKTPVTSPATTPPAVETTGTTATPATTTAAVTPAPATATPAPAPAPAETPAAAPASVALNLTPTKAPAAAVNPVPAAPTPVTKVAATAAPTSVPTPASVVPGPTVTTAPETEDIIQITSAHLSPRFVPPNPLASAVVDTFKVSGIRALANDPKVLMNDRVFRLNDIVERTYGLRLTEIHADRLLFVDEAGATYTKTF